MSLLLLFGGYAPGPRIDIAVDSGTVSIYALVGGAVSVGVSAEMAGIVGVSSGTAGITVGSESVSIVGSG